jgi:hypothetical protein
VENLDSHISVEAIELCTEHIEFVGLPPNSTDKMQPLDVGCLSPLKAGWRKHLDNYQGEDTMPRPSGSSLHAEGAGVGDQILPCSSSQNFSSDSLGDQNVTIQFFSSFSSDSTLRFLYITS